MGQKSPKQFNFLISSPDTIITYGGEMDISIIIPVYNSREVLTQLNNEINEALCNSSLTYEKIYVDDGSTDGSSGQLKTLKSDDDTVRVIIPGGNNGQQQAIAIAMQTAKGMAIVTMDDDLQHDPGDIIRLYNKLVEGYDIVYAVGDNKGSVRKLGSRITASFFRKNFKSLDGNRVSSFRIFNRKMMNEVIRCNYRFIYISAIMLLKNPKVANIESIKRNRANGTSGYNLKKLITLYLKLRFYYGPFVPEIIKPKNKAPGEIAFEDNDAWSRKLSS